MNREGLWRPGATPDKQVCLWPDSLLQMQDTWRTNCRPLWVKTDAPEPQSRKRHWDQESRVTTFSQPACPAPLTGATQRPRLLFPPIPRLTCTPATEQPGKEEARGRLPLVLNKTQNKTSNNTLSKTEVCHPFNHCPDIGNENRVV